MSLIRFITNAVLGILAAAFVLCSFKVYYTLKDYSEGDEAYDRIYEDVVIGNDDDSEEGIFDWIRRITGISDDSEKDTKDTAESSAQIRINLEKLESENSDFIGWLYCPDTVINYPVYQADDNNKYLRTLPDGSYNSCGTLFADCRCSLLLEGKNTIIYGHNMRNNKMFATLENYQEQEYYEAHPFMLFMSGQADYRLEIFSAYSTDRSSDTYTILFETDEDFISYYSMIKEASDIDSRTSVGTNDNIVTLSTCAYGYEDERYVVHCKAVEIK